MAPPPTGPDAAATDAAVVLVGGHESAAGRELEPWVAAGHAYRAVGGGRALTEAVEQALTWPGPPGRPVCVVPVTLGRDPRLVADAARALRWLVRTAGPGRIALAAPFGTRDHLVGWLRAAAARDPAPTGTALLVTAPAADPFADAELFRIARLVRQYGPHRWVEVAFTEAEAEAGAGAGAGADARAGTGVAAEPDPGTDTGVDRCSRLGADRVLLLPAGFGPPVRRPVPGAEAAGPLLSPPAAARVLAARVDAALHRLGHGDDGIAAGLDAEHGHGLAHSHGHGHH